MPLHPTIIRLAAVALLPGVIAACAGSNSMTDKRTVEAYHRALDELPGESAAVERGLARCKRPFRTVLPRALLSQ